MKIAALLCVAAIKVACSEGADQNLFLGETGTHAFEEYTTYRGNSPAGSKCTSKCFDTAPPSPDNLGQTAASWWCFTDEKTNREGGKRFWGECGGCRPATKACGKCCKLYPTEGECNALATDRSQYRRDWYAVVDAKWMASSPHSHNRQCDARVDTSVALSKSQQNICKVQCRTCGETQGGCTSCREDASPVNIFTYGEHYKFNCLDVGTRNQMECMPSQVMRDVNAKSKDYICIKSGVVTLPVFHPHRFHGPNHAAPYNGNCGNWWAVKCRAEKFVRCVNKEKAATKCLVRKELRCVEVCQGYHTGHPGQACKHQGPDMRHATGSAVLELAFTRSGNKCFPGCTDPSHPDGKIKANGFFKGEDSNGPLVASKDWCFEQATGY